MHGLLKYNWPDEIPDEVIQEAYTKAKVVNFSARPFNVIKYRSIALEDLGWWLPLTRVLPLVGITPQMLRPVFNPQRKFVGRRFPFNYGWFGLNKIRFKFGSVELPVNIKNYDELGDFPLNYENFKSLAKVLGKSVRVFREDGGSGSHSERFTAHPSGEIVKAERKSA